MRSASCAPGVPENSRKASTMSPGSRTYMASSVSSPSECCAARKVCATKSTKESCPRRSSRTTLIFCSTSNSCTRGEREVMVSEPSMACHVKPDSVSAVTRARMMWRVPGGGAECKCVFFCGTGGGAWRRFTSRTRSRRSLSGSWRNERGTICSTMHMVAVMLTCNRTVSDS